MAEVKHFLSFADYTKEEILDLMNVTLTLKEAYEKGIRPPLLKDMSLAMLFAMESTRTRVSFEAAMTQLGGHALFLSTKATHAGAHETWKETAAVISSMCDGISARINDSSVLEALAENSTVPVINMLDSARHPSQVIADLLTIIERKPKHKKLEDVVFMYIGDCSSNEDSPYSCCVTLKAQEELFSKLGMTIVLCSPKEYSIGDDWRAHIEAQCAESGGKLIVTDDPYEYIDQVDFIYTGVTWYYDVRLPEELAKKTFYPRYSVNADLLSKAKPSTWVMHFLPGNRGWEITDDVWDGPQSALLPQAENRLHAEKGILAYLLYPHRAHPSKQMEDYYLGKLEDMLTVREPNYQY